MGGEIIREKNCRESKYWEKCHGEKITRDKKSVYTVDRAVDSLKKCKGKYHAFLTCWKIFFFAYPIYISKHVQNFIFKKVQNTQKFCEFYKNENCLKQLILIFYHIKKN